MDQPQTILLIEDEEHLAFSLKLNLELEGYRVVHTGNGLEAIELFQQLRPLAAIILDIMLPDKDGFQIARYIRGVDSKIGILMLTALAGDEDRIRGLGLGVDDYLTKPLHLQELLMRVQRMVKRSQFFDSFAATTDRSSAKLQLGDLELDTEACTLTQAGEPTCQLTALEADILKEFMTHPGKVLSREHLLQKVWGLTGSIETRTVDNFIARLRRLIEKTPAKPRVLVSVRGRGYKMEPEP